MAIHAKRNAPKTDAGPCSEEQGNTRVDRMRDKTASAPQCAKVRHRAPTCKRCSTNRGSEAAGHTGQNMVFERELSANSSTDMDVHRCK